MSKPLFSRQRRHLFGMGSVLGVLTLIAALLVLQTAFRPTLIIGADAAPTVSSSIPAHNATGVARNAVITITFSEDVALAPDWFTLICQLSGTHLFEELLITSTGGAQTWLIDSERDFNAGDTCTGTVTGAKVSDLDIDDPPNTMNSNYTFTFETIFENIAPYFYPLGNQVGTEFQPLIFTAVAAEPDPSQSISYGLTSAPAGAKIDPATGVFTWIPNGAQGGILHPVTISATDSGGLTGTVTITVQVNDIGVDLVTNGAFETKALIDSKLPADWKARNITRDSLRCNKPTRPNTAFEGECAFRFRGGAGENSRLLQSLPVAGLTAGDVLTLNTRILTENMAVGGLVRVKVQYVNNTSANLDLPVPVGTSGAYINLTQSLTLNATVQSAKLQLRNTAVSGKFTLDMIGVLWQDSAITPTNTPIPTSTPQPPIEPRGKTIASSRMTGTTYLFAPGTGIGNITIQCRLTLNDASKMTEECWFSNLDDVNKHIVYCDMGDLQTEFQSFFGAPPEAPEVRLQVVNNELTCTPLGYNGATESSVHFACAEVALAPNELRQKHIFTNDTTYLPWSTFDVGAWQFQVNYADVWNLLPQGIAGYNEESCQQVIAQGGWLVLDSTPETAYWVVSAFPFNDPMIVFQALNSPTWQGVTVPQHVHFNEYPCAPQGMNFAALAPCPPNDGSAPISTDINLFYWESHMPPPTNTRTLFPTRMSLESPTDLAQMGIRYEISPKPGELFNMRASKEDHGRLTLCAASITDRCVTPDVPEGTQITIRHNFYNAEQREARFTDAAFANQTQWVVWNRQAYTEAESERWIFAQEGVIIKDTQPPVVQNHTARLENGALVIDVTASDQTTQPTFANVWYSVDGGITWQQQVLDPTADFTQELKTRTFSGRIGLNGVRSAATVQYMIAVQDMVYNWVYYGIGTAG